MNHRTPDHEKLRNVLISKLGLPVDQFQRDNEIAEAVGKLLRERDDALKRATNITEYDDGMRKAMQRIAVACGKKFTVDIGYEQLPVLVEELLARPDTTQPQLNEIRYVLHGDIQPCAVLYSDDTTTLLRLDEGDIMCETDTIEWSDSVTYRCQELLKGVKGTTLGVLAQLVRDERILLNDDADLGADEAYFRDEPCVECNLPFDKNSMTCPVCNTIRPTER